MAVFLMRPLQLLINLEFHVSIEFEKLSIRLLLGPHFSTGKTFELLMRITNRYKLFGC